MLFSIALGSALGGVVCWLFGAHVQQRVGLAFPAGTLVVNLTGSLLLGFLMRFALETPGVTPEARAFLTTGFCGGYTTFSTFSYESAALIEEGQYRQAALYAVLSVGLALLGTFAGFALAREALALRHRS